MKTTVFRLKHNSSDAYLYLHISFNEDYNNSSISYYLSTDRDGICIFETDSLEKAKKVHKNKKSHNSDYESDYFEMPEHDYNLNDISIVEVEIEEKELYKIKCIEDND